jgi:hypothetical protein
VGESTIIPGRAEDRLDFPWHRDVVELVKVKMVGTQPLERAVQLVRGSLRSALGGLARKNSIGKIPTNVTRHGGFFRDSSLISTTDGPTCDIASR